MGCFRVAKLLRFCLKNIGIIFRGWQRPRKIILILFRKNGRVGGTTRLSLDISTVRKENFRPKYLKRKGIKDTCYERDFMTSLSVVKQAEIIEAFKSTSRYLDDLLNIDNPYFEGMVNRIYLPELQLNKANTSDTEAPF